MVLILILNCLCARGIVNSIDYSQQDDEKPGQTRQGTVEKYRAFVIIVPLDERVH